MPHTSAPTNTGPRLLAALVPCAAVEKIIPATNTSVNVAMTSAIRLAPVERMAGALQKHASLDAGSLVSTQCGR